MSEIPQNPRFHEPPQDARINYRVRRNLPWDRANEGAESPDARFLVKTK